MAASASAPASYDRQSELKAFDATKAGVKGLVDAGITAVPRIFHDPTAAGVVEPRTKQPSSPRHKIPVIDLAAAEHDRSALVAQVKAAAETAGFFQVVNHGVPAGLLAETLASVRRFHEEPLEAKAPYYTRDPAARVKYQSNFNLFASPAANWRDTLYVVDPGLEEAEVVPPPACRSVVPEYTTQVKNLGGTLLELLSEALGLRREYLERDAGCLDGILFTGHYYPPCPEPRLTMGSTRHCDPSFLTVLLQDDVGGLQVLLDGSWVDVPPVPGALVVNVGDYLQLMSNDRFKSVEHRVPAMAAGSRPRVSVACFFRPRDGDRVYGPILSSSYDERPRYRNVTVDEFFGFYKEKGLDARSKLQHFRL